LKFDLNPAFPVAIIVHGMNGRVNVHGIFMKTGHFMLILSVAAWTGCSTTHPAGNAKTDPETMLITYHARPGKEAELQAVLSSAWQTYRAGNLVVARSHTVVRKTEDGDKTSFVEIFTWASHATPEHAPDAVQKVWEQEQSLCEARNGHRGIEGGEVELVTGR
jgi:hypothetical protein